MTKYAKRKWDKNKQKLQKEFENGTGWNDCAYVDIVKTAIELILNDEECGYGEGWNVDKITIVNDGGYQGTLLFIIPLNTYQPCEYEYLVTYVNYGSCSGCDTLQAIQSWGDKMLTETQVKDFMTLARDIIMNIKKPYNCGWRNDDEFTEVEETDET